MTPQIIKPSRWYFLLSPLIIGLGVTLFFLITIKGISGIPDKLTQMEAPGMSEMTFSVAGKYTIFYEHQSVLNGKVYDTGENLSGLWCNVISKETNSPVALTQPSVSTTYTVGNRSGVSVLEFTIERPGVYQVSAKYPEKPDGHKVVLALGHGVASTITATVVGALSALFGSIALAVVIAIIIFMKRRRAWKTWEWRGYPSYQPSPMR